MLQRVFFQDNLYQLARSIDTVREGMALDLAREFFFDKTVDDIFFFDSSVQKIFEQIRENRQLNNYNTLLQSLYSCQNRYIALLDTILEGQCAMNDQFKSLQDKLSDIKRRHLVSNRQLAVEIQKNDRTTDNRDIVSHNELSELLNF